MLLFFKSTQIGLRGVVSALPDCLHRVVCLILLRHYFIATAGSIRSDRAYTIACDDGLFLLSFDAVLTGCVVVLLRLIALHLMAPKKDKKKPEADSAAAAALTATAAPAGSGGADAKKADKKKDKADKKGGDSKKKDDAKDVKSVRLTSLSPPLPPSLQLTLIRCI